MTNSDVTANVLATIGTVLWCIQLIPQIIRNYRVKDCTGFPPLMMFLWMISGIPFGIYFTVIDATIPVKIQPHLFTFFALVAFIQALYYPPVRLAKKTVAVAIVVTYAVAAGLEAGVILNMIPRFKAVGSDITWGPVLAVAVVASVLLAAGFLPPFWEIWTNRGRVVGLNFLFLTLDCAGALFSIASVAISSSEPGKQFDTAGIVLYIVVAAAEIAIFVCHGVWCIRHKSWRRDFDPETISVGTPSEGETESLPEGDLKESHGVVKG